MLQITARFDYALRAMTELAAAYPAVVSSIVLAGAQQIPATYLQHLLTPLRRANLVRSHRGAAAGGFSLARPASEITVGEIIVAIDHNLVSVLGVPATAAQYHGTAAGLRHVWLAAETAIHTALHQITLDDILAGPDGTESVEADVNEEPRDTG